IELDNNVKKQKDKELDVKNQKDSIRKYEQQLDGIKNNKEYKALNSQISTLKDKIFNFESELIAVMDEETALKERKKQAEESLKSAKKALSENEDILKKEIIKVEDDIVELKGNRNSIAHEIPMSLVKKYAQLIKNKNRKAVVFLNGNSCGGCGFHIRPQLLIEIKQNDNVNYCENCGRIIAPNVDN
ncbi:MAG TPA: C4-type zinc ribbon domain-containing protein, partial [Candidatus Cloacimonadota bacterium]|nr:C4-type zinc ribbon domain-containing protein [Candidatus Cloacimonadota bacterium]